MTKRSKSKATRADDRPVATNVDFPVFVPNEKGETQIDVGKARLRYSTLVVEFKDTASAVAIQRMIERGVVMGFGLVMVKPDVVNEMYQEVVAKEESEAEERKNAAAEELDLEVPEETVEDRSDDVDR